MKYVGLFLALLFSVLGSTQNHSFRSHDSIQLVYDDEGSGPVVVLLHGFINTRKSWGRAALRNSLIEKGYRVIVPDLRGNGDSDKPHDEHHWNNNNEVRDIICLIDSLKIKEYMVVAYSRGATVGSELITLDDRVTKIVLGGMSDEYTDPSWEIPSIFADAFAGRIPLSEMTEGAVNYAKSINADLTCLSFQQKYQPSPSKEELGKLNLPVLVIVGDQDDAENKTKSLSAVFINATSIIVEGNHNNTYKQENFAEAVIRFLKS